MIIIEDIQYIDKFKPTDTDIDWALYNVGEPLDIVIEYRVEEVLIPSSQDLSDSDWFMMNPTPQVSGEASNSNLIYAEDSTAFQNFYVGDDIQITGAVQASNDGAYTVIEKIGDQMIRVYKAAWSGFSTSFLEVNTGFIYVTSLFKGHKFFWNWIENDSAVNYIDVTSGEENQLYYASTTTGMGATSMVWNGNGTNQVGSATIEGNGTTTYSQKFIIKISAFVTPLFLASQYADTLARLDPDYFDASKCLKHIFRLEINRDLSNPNDTQTIDYTERIGNTGWFNENYNGQKQNYTTSNLVLTRVSDSATLTALELSTQVDATFRVTNTVDSPFRNTTPKTKGMGIFWTLPDNETQYQNNGRTLEENFVHDYALATSDAGLANGNNYGTTLQAIEETEITHFDAANIDVRIRFDFGSLSQSIVNENDFKQYLFGFTIENSNLGREVSDKITLLLNVAEFELQLFDVDLITNNTGFLFHRYSTFGEGVANPSVMPVDDMVAYSQFSIDFNGLESDGINILNTSHELVLTHSTNTEIVLESNTYSTAATSFLNGYVPIIDMEQNRAFTITDNDFRKLVTVKRDSANDSGGTVFAYESTYPFFVRWETWEALLGVNNPPSGVYDSTLPNNGLNHFWYRFSTLGYTLNYRLRFTIEQNGQQFNQEFDSPMTMYDFNSNSDYNNEYIKSYDAATSTELINGSDKLLQGYVDTRLEAAFDKTVGTLPAIADVDIVFWIIGKEKGTIKSVKRASSFYADSGDTWFKGITTPNLVDKTKTSTLYEGKVLVDFTKLSGSDFTVYSRLHETPPSCPILAIAKEGGVCISKEGTTIILKENT